MLQTLLWEHQEMTEWQFCSQDLWYMLKHCLQPLPVCSTCPPSTLLTTPRHVKATGQLYAAILLPAFTWMVPEWNLWHVSCCVGVLWFEFCGPVINITVTVYLKVLLNNFSLKQGNKRSTLFLSREM